jgi:hypothetical protein
MSLAHGKRAGRDAIEELIRELDELRELDRLRNAHAPGSAAHDAATLEVDLRSRRLMDRFRDLKERRNRDSAETRLTRPVDVRDQLERGGSALRN